MTTPKPGPASGEPSAPTNLASAITRLASALVSLAPLALVVLAEAAWISVLGGLLQEVAFHEPVLGIPAIAVFVTAGVVTARLLAGRLAGRWPVTALVLIVCAGAAGWLSSADARAALDHGLGPSLGAHPGGWMAGLALLRGFAHARPPLAEDTVERLLWLGVPGLALCAILGGAISEPYRTRFLGDALNGAIVFVVAATLALALTRLSAIGSGAGFDWRRNPMWLGMTLVFLVMAIVAAVPLSLAAATVAGVVFGVALGPIIVLGFLSGLDRAMRRVVVFVAVGVGIVWLVARLFGGNPGEPTPRPGVATGESGPSVAEQLITMSLGGLFLVMTIVSILVLAALWTRRHPSPDKGVEETRTIDRGVGDVVRRRHRSRLSRRTEPVGAAAAYVRLVEDLDRHPGVRREPAETPAEHAARLRSTGRAELSLDLLAADYALNRYGGVALPAREDRRAVARWRQLRRRLTRTTADPSDPP
jgi:hypothetical protein